MSNEDLGELIGSLTQAVERVRITVQLRRLASKKGRGPSLECVGWRGWRRREAAFVGSLGAAWRACRREPRAALPRAARLCSAALPMPGSSPPPRCVLPHASFTNPCPAPPCAPLYTRSLSFDGHSGGGMTREAMRRALEELQNGHGGGARRGTAGSEASSDLSPTLPP